MDAPKMGNNLFWWILGALCAIGFFACVGGVIYGLTWAIHHITII